LFLPRRFFKHHLKSVPTFTSKGDGIESMALQDSSAQEGEYFYGENLVDVYKESPFDDIIGRCSDVLTPAAYENIPSKATIEKRVKNDFKSQSDIEKCLAHLRRGKEKREEDNQINKSMEMRYYEPVADNATKNGKDVGLDHLSKNIFKFPSDIRNNMKGTKESNKSHHILPERSPNHLLPNNEVEPIVTYDSAIPSTDPSTVLWVKSFRAVPARKTSIGFGSTFSPEPRESFSKSTRKTSATTEKRRSPSAIIRSYNKPSPVVANSDEPAAATRKKSVISKPASSSTKSDVVTPDTTVQASPSPLSHSSEKSQQSGKSHQSEKSQQSGKSLQSQSSRTKQKAQPTIVTTATRRDESPKRGRESPGDNAAQRNPSVRKIHQKLIDKYQTVLGIDVERFDGSADTFKTLIDLKQ
jgi:hypothetical protein